MSRLNSVWTMTAMAAAATLSLASGASAKPLDYEFCQELKAEQRTLRNTGIERKMQRGPEWAKANLPGEEMGQIRRYLTVEELIRFRCGIKRRPKAAKTRTAARPPAPMPLPDRYRFAPHPGAEPAPAPAQILGITGAPELQPLPTKQVIPAFKPTEEAKRSVTEQVLVVPKTPIFRAPPPKQIIPAAQPDEQPKSAAMRPAEPAAPMSPAPAPQQAPPPAQGAASTATTPSSTAKPKPPPAPAKQAPPATEKATAPGRGAALSVTKPEPPAPVPVRKTNMLPQLKQPPVEKVPPVSVSIRDIDTKEIADGMGVEVKAKKKKPVTQRRRTIRRRKAPPTAKEQDWLSFD